MTYPNMYDYAQYYSGMGGVESGVTQYQTIDTPVGEVKAYSPQYAQYLNALSPTGAGILGGVLTPEQAVQRYGDMPVQSLVQFRPDYAVAPDIAMGNAIPVTSQDQLNAILQGNLQDGLKSAPYTPNSILPSGGAGAAPAGSNILMLFLIMSMMKKRRP